MAFTLISLLLITLLLFFIFPSSHFLSSHFPSSHFPSNRRSLLSNGGIFNYHSFFNNNPSLSLSSLSLFLLLHFHILITTAHRHFSVVTTKLASHLRLSPSMAAVTLLSLGNGAPDVFSSLAALRSGQPRTGLGAILSAGAFVSALVVGFVAIYAAPFSVDPAPFIRDVLFYLTSALFLFYVYLSAEIFLWQAIGFVGFYVFFVGFVFYMDLGIGDRRVKIGNESVSDLEQQKELITSHQEQVKRRSSRFRRAFELISKLWEVPVSTLLKLTIPQPAPSQWSRFYASANIALCPLALLYACNSIMPFNHPIVFLLPNTHFPLWSVVLTTSFSLAFLHFIIEKEPPKTEQLPVVVTAFVMSVFWISTTAGELVNCLEAIGILLKLPPAILGLTVLAWGNSVGDLVADVAVAKAGHPAMAMAGCFAGPMFNMLVGLGSALVIQTANIYPRAYELNFHVGIVIAFVFLILSLMGSLLVITWCRFRVPRFWGFCLVGLYIAFMAVSLLIAMFSG
ncbi:PREDICTED: cation/calcium exchanger 5 isoform X1 [Lupinus angustifolius]|uniref:cation/calcium exchanger 5 isoform X1 n=1 Tax=Lupinus angustifolius TaxID=3871 RepID=UPI00092F2EFC|nr:PREDICTED: cation/calcium exchanger 5 isoform X1 [Lupinus angustifolius]